jgi:AsmA-like C-terminal region
MSPRKKWWLAGIGVFLLISGVAAYIGASSMAKRFEPMVREQAIQYLRQRFHSDVEIATLHIHLPKMSTLGLLLKHQSGAKVHVDGEGLSMRFNRARGLPPMFIIRKFAFVVDLQSLREDRKSVELVTLEGMQIHIPPKEDAAAVSGTGSGARPIYALFKDIHITDALLVLHPKDETKEPLKFKIDRLRLTSVATDTAMKYDAALDIPKPPGKVRSSGSFGPWSADEPGDTPLGGSYTFDKADLGVFSGIAGTLTSSGSFEGTLDSVHARGEASVPDFRLKMAGNRVQLRTEFEVLVDGTNGDTVLQPVKARLGSTSFTTTGAVIKHEGKRRRAITLRVSMPNGDLRDLLRLASRGSPFMEGRVTLNTKIEIPPLSSTVKQKLRLDGTFNVHDAKFLRSNIQDQIDQLSRRGQGQPENQEIDEVVSKMKGSFRLENQNMTFRSLSFEVPGAVVNMAGDYDLERDTLDFHGAVRLVAKVSQTMTGWKRWALKPVDPFFAKNGAGTFLRIKVVGSSRHPQFGLDRGHKKAGEAARVKPANADRMK